MTISKKYLIELADIISIRITCGRCGGSLSIPIRKVEAIHEKCQICNVQMLFQGSGYGSKDIEYLLEHLAKLRGGEHKASRIVFEIEPPE